MRSRSWKVIALLLLGTHLCAQEPPGLRGRVVTEGGIGVRGAVVSVDGVGGGTLTDGDGAFRLERIPREGARLRVHAMGYAPVAREVGRYDGGPLEIVLKPTPLAVAGIDVTATPVGRDPMAVARPTSQLGGRELDRALGGTLAGTLEAQPGMAVRYNGPAASMPVIRGLTGDRILVLQDGRRAGDLSGSADDHSLTIDPLVVKRVEVVRGPASLLYGTNALGGVVNVISADLPLEVPPRAAWSGGVQAESAFPGVSASLRGELPLGERWALAARGGARTAGDARVGGEWGEGRLENSFHRNRHGAAGVGYVGEGVSGGLLVEGYGMQHGVPLPPEEDEEIVLEGRKLGASGRLDVRTGLGALPAARVRLDVTRYAHEERVDGEPEMAFALSTLSGDLLLRQAATGPLAEGAWGVSSLGRDYGATGEEQLTAPARSAALGAFTYQEVLLGTGGATLQLGARVDRHRIASRDDPAFGPGVTRGFTALSGSLGAVVPLGTHLTAGVSAARSFRSPTVEELFSNALHIGTAAFEVGDSRLAPEYAQGVDALLRARHERWTGEISIYTSELRGFIHLEERGDTLIHGTRWPILAYVQNRARFRGFEASAEWAPTRSLALGVRGDAVRASLDDGTPVPFIPAARLGGSARWEGGALSLGGGVRHGFAQPRVGLAEEPPTDAYTLLDLHAGWRLLVGARMHTVLLRAENLTDELYRDAASRVKSFAPNPGRNVSLLYRVHF